MSEIIHGLSNEEYHNQNGKWGEYISSSQLKLYGISPKHYRYCIDHPQEQTDAMRLGSLFHDVMAAMAEGASMRETIDAIAVFELPINERTGKPFGPQTGRYKDAYKTFTESVHGTLFGSAEDKELVSAMVHSLLDNCGCTSEQVRKLLRWGKPEVSIFHETADGIKIKIRPDLLTKSKIVDYKTVSSDDFSEDAINRLILKYGYHISAAQYVWTYHEVTGKWVTFYFVIVSKLPPHDAVMVDMTNYTYRYLPDVDLVIPGCGALEFRRLLDLHTKCVKSGEWLGAEAFISGDRYKILEIEPPRGYKNKFIEEI